MAPEFPPSLVVFDAHFEDDQLLGLLQYVEAPLGSRLRVRWNVGNQPANYIPIGGGVAYVHDQDVVVLPISEDASPNFLGESRYQWTEGLQFGVPWTMFVLILPEGYTLVNPQPHPVGTKIFQKRLAVYWILNGDDLGRTKVECTITKTQRDIGTELIRLNKNYLTDTIPAPSNIEVEGVTVSKTILFLSADPTDAPRLRLGEEVREIQEKLQLARLRDQFTLHQRMSVRPVDLSQALLDTRPQIVHFSGHGTSTGALSFEDEEGKLQPVEATALAALFELFTDTVQCVILNACYAEVQAGEIAKHIPYVIGMDKKLSDKAALSFTVGLYQALGAGNSFEQAYQSGCVQIRLQGIPEHLTPTLVKKS